MDKRQENQTAFANYLAALDIQVNKSKEYKDILDLTKNNTKALQDSPSTFMKFQQKEAKKSGSR